MNTTNSNNPDTQNTTAHTSFNGIRGGDPTRRPIADSPVKVKRVSVVHVLRLNGFKVRIQHYRFGHLNIKNVGTVIALSNKKFLEKVCGNGGVTEIDIISPKGEGFRGRADCSVNDNFDHNKGIQYALIEAFGLNLNKHNNLTNQQIIDSINEVTGNMLTVMPNTANNI